jgi:methionyl-tRNA formyltransferase
MRILFIGAVDFSRHCLEEVLKCGEQVVSVLTLTERDATRHSDYADLSGLVSAHGIPLHHIRDVNEVSTLGIVQQAQPDVIFVFGWSQLISKRVLEIPPLGCIGTHPALLPRNRGRHPLIWTLVEGLTEGGLTFFFLDEGADSGDILWQKSFPVSIDDDASSLYQKMKTLAVEGIREFLPHLQRGTAQRIRQDHSKATYWRKRTEEDGEIQWSAPTVSIYNLIRALTRPYVGAHTFMDGQRVTVWRSKILPTPPGADRFSNSPGAIVSQNEARLEVRTGDGVLTVVDYSWQGGPLRVGMCLGK